MTASSTTGFVARLDRRWGRAYFAAQAIAGALWWVSVFAFPPIRVATLGGLDASLVAVFDIPLFVLASVASAAGFRWAAWIVTPWTTLVASAMALYATFTGAASWGALLMIAAAIGSVGASVLLIFDRLPIEWMLRGPFQLREARATGGHLTRTFIQVAIFWFVFLAIVPGVIAAGEARWGLRAHFPYWLNIVGVLLLVAASALGVWSAITMAREGKGTPLPSDMAREFVASGPYAIVRNPMAIAGIAQGVAVGFIVGSWLVVIYALCGSLVWNALIRPQEEADLERRFGAEFRDYAQRVGCWLPRLR